MCFNKTGDISTLCGSSLKQVDKFVSSTKKDIDMRLTKAWTAIDKLSIIWKLDMTDKMKRSFFQAAVVLILQYGCTTWMLTKRLEKKLDGKYTRMLPAILNKSWRQHPTKHQLYGHLPPITKTIQDRRTRHAEHCWRSRDKLISDVLLWTPTYGRAKAGRPARTYIQQLCEDTGCSPEDLPEAMNDREMMMMIMNKLRCTRRHNKQIIINVKLGYFSEMASKCKLDWIELFIINSLKDVQELKIKHWKWLLSGKYSYPLIIRWWYIFFCC